MNQWEDKGIKDKRFSKFIPQHVKPLVSNTGSVSLRKEMYKITLKARFIKFKFT